MARPPAGESTPLLNSPRMSNPNRPKPFPGSPGLNEATRGGVLISPQNPAMMPRHFTEHDAIVAEFATEPSRGDLLVIANQLSISDGWSFDRFERDKEHDRAYRLEFNRINPFANGANSHNPRRVNDPPITPDMPLCRYYLWGRRVINVAKDGSLYPAPGGKFCHAAKQLQDRAAANSSDGAPGASLTIAPDPAP